MANRKVRIIRTKSRNDATGTSEPVSTDNGTTEITSGSEPASEIASGEINSTSEPATIDPESIGGNTGSESSEPERKRRGRPPGTGNKTRAKETTQDLGTTLYSIHLMLAAMTNVQQLMISQAEADELGRAVSRVNELYGGIVIPEKQLALINLAMVAGKIYVPRAVFVMQKSKQNKPVEVPANVQVAPQGKKEDTGFVPPTFPGSEKVN